MIIEDLLECEASLMRTQVVLVTQLVDEENEIATPCFVP